MREKKFVRKNLWISGLLFCHLLGLNFAQGTGNKTLIDRAIPLLEEYCYDCHGDGAQKGNFAIDELLSLGKFNENQKQWDRIWKNLHNRNMPPANVFQPMDHEISTILSWIEKESFQLDPNEIDPGHVVLRRLNRAEYENTMMDLFQVKINANNYFPPDDTGYGFDTIGEVLTLSPLLMEKYFGMAEIVMEKTLGPVDDRGEIVRFNVDEIEGGKKQGNFSISHQSGSSGIYQVRVWTSASRAGNYLAKVKVTINDKEIKTSSIKSENPQKFIYGFQFSSKENTTNKISFSFVNDFDDQKNKNRKINNQNLYMEDIEIFFPPAVPLKFRESRKRLFGEWETEKINDELVIKTLEKWLPRIYRMPLSESEFSRHKAFYRKIKAQGLNPVEAVRNTFKAALISPRFIFREEKKNQHKKSILNINEIDEFALAHRMSFFLWSSIPDDGLWRLAERGELRANLGKEFRRMLSDEKISEFVQNFCGQWLQLRDLNLVSPDPEKFPKFTKQVRVSMIKETEEFFNFLLTQNLPIDFLLGANFSMINQDLADYYGLQGEFDQNFKKFTFQEKGLKRRGGLLTHGSILTITSNPTRTSPVKRGKWVLDNLLAAPPRDPPPGVAELEETNMSGVKKLTFREQMVQHSKTPACYSCHASMDNLGYALENFDAVGNWRSDDDGKPINASGRLSSGEDFTGVSELQTFLKQNKKQALIRCITQKLFVFGLGRGLSYKDRLAVERVVNSFQNSQVKLGDLLFKVIQSQPFQFSN